MPLSKRAAAEFVGTFWLVFGGCGSAVLAAAFPNLGIGFLGVAFAFGLTVLTMAFAIGHISGCHLNPAVSVGLLVAKRFPGKDFPAYLVAQVLGGMAGAAVLYVIASGKPGFELGGFASNGYAENSPGGYSLEACLVAEVVLTFMFLMIILGVYRQARSAGLRAHRHRPGPDADPPDRYPGHESVGEPGAQHRAGGLRRRMGDPAAMALLAGADRRRGHRGLCLSHNCRQRRPASARASQDVDDGHSASYSKLRRNSSKARLSSATSCSRTAIRSRSEGPRPGDDASGASASSIASTSPASNCAQRGSL